MPKDGEMVLKDDSLDSFGHVRLSGVGEWLAKEIERRTGKEARTTVLGHVQRGGTPSAFDRWLATRFGLHAIDAVRDEDWGKMVALQGTDIVRVPICRGHGAAEDGRSRAVRGGSGLLRLSPGSGRPADPSAAAHAACRPVTGAPISPRPQPPAAPTTIPGPSQRQHRLRMELHTRRSPGPRSACTSPVTASRLTSTPCARQLRPPPRRRSARVKLL